MSTSDRPRWNNGQVGIITLLLVVLFIWIIVGGRPFFRSTRGDIKATVQDAGHDLKSTGRDVADSIRRTVQ